MSNLSQFLGGGGGGLTPKFQEFNSSGTFTPSQALIDAGGYIEVFLVGGGGGTTSNGNGANGGEVEMERMYLTSTSSISVTIGAGGSSSNGSASSFAGSSAGGVDLTANGGSTNYNQNVRRSPSWGSYNASGAPVYTAGNGVFGYGAGGADGLYNGGGVFIALANTGQGAYGTGGSGYCLVKWYE